MKRALTAAVLMITVLLSSLLLAGCPRAERPAPEPKAQQEAPKPKEQPPESKPPEQKAAVKPGQYFPLTLGSTWEYQGEGNEYASFTREVIFAKGSRAQIREDNGGTVLAAIFEVTDDAVTRVFNQGEVYDRVNLLDRQPTEKTVILKSPLQPGAKWPGTNGEREIVDVNATVDTPAGKFEKCVKVKIAGQHSTVFEYFKEGVGMVKREFISGETRVTSALKKYSIKK